ncbi:MAG: tetratricopeptide repeat protein, partial [Methanoregula sp.]|nr:tetratricopeptide repeat protein [Methanoregula sp.]
NKGVAYAALKKYEEAILYFDEVLKTHPDNEFACFIKGITLATLKMFDEITLSFGGDYSL